jgi:hypothetical protein
MRWRNPRVSNRFVTVVQAVFLFQLYFHRAKVFVLIINCMTWLEQRFLSDTRVVPFLHDTFMATAEGPVGHYAPEGVGSHQNKCPGNSNSQLCAMYRFGKQMVPIATR